MVKKNKKLFLCLGTPITLASILFSTISCSTEKTFVEKVAELNINVELNDKGKKITSFDFVKKYNDYIKTGINENPFYTYTNYNEVIKKYHNFNIQFSIIEDSISLYDSVVNFEALFEQKNEQFNIKKNIVGFNVLSSSLDEKMNEIEKDLMEKTKLRSFIGNIKTAEEVAQQWLITPSSERMELLEQNILNINKVTSTKPFDIDGLYDVFITIDDNFKDEDEAKKIVNWNSESTNSKIKGNTLYINFKVSLRSKIDNSDFEKIKYLKIPATGFLSYQEKFDYLKNNFVKNPSIKIIESLGNAKQLSSKKIFTEYHSAISSNEKFDVLAKYLSVQTEEQQIKNDPEGILYKITNVIEPITIEGPWNNETELKLVCDLSWKDVRATDVEIVVYGFQSADDFFQSLINNLNDSNLIPTQFGGTFTSKEVVDIINKENETSKYQELTRYVANLPQKDASINYEVEDISWNEFETNLSTKGTKLFLTIKINYEGKNAKVRKEVYNFYSPKRKYEQFFNERVNEIKLSLTDNAKKTMIVDEINSDNYNQHIEGWPIEENGFSILDVGFNYSKGMEGILKVEFIYKWVIDGYILTAGVEREIGTMVKYPERSRENYNKLSSLMNNSSYWNTIIKKDESTSNWFSSYFGYELVNMGYNTSGMIQGFSRLFDLPPKSFGVNFDFTNISYSYRDSSIDNRTLKITTTISDIYNKTSKNFTHYVNGFKDPYTSTAYNTSRLNSGTVVGETPEWYDNAPSDLKFGNGNYQNAWGAEDSAVGWGYNKPYRFYVKKSQNEWINYAKEKIHTPFVRLYGNSSYYSIKITNQSWHWNGIHNGPANGGAARGPIKFKAVFSTVATDSKGNSARGKYRDLETQYLIMNLLFKNNFWK